MSVQFLQHIICEDGEVLLGEEEGGQIEEIVEHFIPVTEDEGRTMSCSLSTTSQAAVH